MRLHPAPTLALVAALMLSLSSERAESQGADGRFTERRSSHFVLRQDVDLDRYHGVGGALEFERGVLAVLEQGYTALDAELGLRAPAPLEVHVWDAARFDAEFAGVFRFAAAGFFGGTIHVRGETVMTNPLRGTLHHELVHASFDAVAPGLVLPAWLNEGLAEWFESRMAGARGHLSAGRWALLEEAARRGSLPSTSWLGSAGLGRLDPQSAGLAYVYSHGLIDHVARRRGGDVLRRLVRELVRTANLDRAFRRAAKDTPEGFETSFRRELGAR